MAMNLKKAFAFLIAMVMICVGFISTVIRYVTDSDIKLVIVH